MFSSWLCDPITDLLTTQHLLQSQEKRSSLKEESRLIFKDLYLIKPGPPRIISFLINSKSADLELYLYLKYPFAFVI
jgi:hypothetical protein